MKKVGFKGKRVSVTGKACPVVLDFNVDGYVLDKI